MLCGISAEEDAWWCAYRHWVRPGLVAAAVAFLAVGFTIMHSRELEARMAVRTIIEVPRTPAQQLATQLDEVPSREATLRYVIAP